MHRLVSFIGKVYVGVIFIILESLAIHIYSNSTTYTQAKLLTVSNVMVRGVHSAFSGIGSFFRLGRENRLLNERVTELETKLAAYRHIETENELAGLENVETSFSYIPAHIVNNTLTHQRNYITINKGYADGVSDGMAVLTAGGYMLGYVMNCSEKYAVCMSILNIDFRASGRPMHSAEFGSITWNGADRHFVTLSEIPKYTAINVGDTIVSTSYSFNFPEGIRIGTVDKITTQDNSASCNVRIRLGADVMTTNNVVLIQNRDAQDILDLENSVKQ